MLNPTIPLGLALTIGGFLILLTLFFYWTTSSRLTTKQRLFLLVTRLLATIAVVFLLLQPSKIEEIPQVKTNRAVLIGMDTSKSMTQDDEGGTTRLDAARKVLRDNGFLSGNSSDDVDIRLFQFDEDAQAITPKAIESVNAEGDTTQFHKSISSMANSVSNTDIEAMILLSDGHDFELAGVARSAEVARRKRFPIFAVPFGKTGKVRDIAVRIDNYQPYAYIKQETQISARLRLIGCEYETITVQLLRNGKLVKTQKVTVGEELEMPVIFAVKEPEVGQFQFEVKAVVTGEETDRNNNNAFTYLNVIDEKIRILILEGSPYWDTTFLQRSLFKNDKIELDAILAFAGKRARRIRNDNIRGELRIPLDPEEYNQYDAIILGRSLNRLIDPKLLADNLTKYVDEYGGTLIFSRGRALDDENEALADLEPVVYDSGGSSGGINLSVATNGKWVSAFKMIEDKLKTSDSLPSLIAARRTTESKTLAATLAEVQDEQTGETISVITHRRFGKGQVLNVNVAGLWKWAFNSKSDEKNNVFDQFWDQLLVWLLSQSDVAPKSEFGFRANQVNILLGEAIDFRLTARNQESLNEVTPLKIYKDDQLVTLINWNPKQPKATSRSTQFKPNAAGHYEALADLPNGEQMAQKFLVFEERPELTEVATDIAYLTRLCKQSGGEILDRNDMAQLSRTLALNRQKEQGEADTRITPIWDQFWVFFLILLLFAADWFMRRRWGLT